jgi:hypothetical protein
MSVTIEDIEALRQILAELPRHQPAQVSKQEAIALLSSELGGARRQGYSPEELARILSERGLGINAATLRGYLRRNRSGRKWRASKAPRVPGDQAASRTAPARIEPAARTMSPAVSTPPPLPKAPATTTVTPAAHAAVGTQSGSGQTPKPLPDGPGATTAQGPRR